VKSSRIPLLTPGTVLVVVEAATTITSSGFDTPALASDLTIEDLISRDDPLQDKVTICHVPKGAITKAHDITVDESVVPNHLAHGDWIDHCLLSQNPTITTDPPTSCTSTENELVAYLVLF
jgi:hypothetical protein